MSLTDFSTAPDVATPPRAALRFRATGTMWGRVALVCAPLLVSGGVRWWQARRVGRHRRRQAVAVPVAQTCL